MHFIILLSIGIIELCISSLKWDNTKKRKVKSVLMGIVIFLFAALRSKNVGVDTISYFEDYNLYINRSYSDVILMGYRDPGYSLFVKTLTVISKDPQLLLIVVGAIVAICFSVFAYQMGEPFLHFVLFISLRIYSFTLTGLRQAIAMSILLIAVCFLVKRRLAIFVLLILFAGIFHASALIGLILLPLFLFDKTFLVSVGAILIAAIDVIGGHILTRYVNLMLFSNRFLGYVRVAEDSKTSISSTFIIYIAIFVCMIWKYSQMKSKEKLMPFYFRALSVGMMFSIIGQGFPNMFRISYYFVLFMFGKVDDMIDCVFAENSRKIAKWILVSALILQYLYFGPGAGTQNYQFFWSV